MRRRAVRGPGANRGATYTAARVGGRAPSRSEALLFGAVADASGPPQAWVCVWMAADRPDTGRTRRSGRRAPPAMPSTGVWPCGTGCSTGASPYRTQRRCTGSGTRKGRKGPGCMASPSAAVRRRCGRPSPGPTPTSAATTAYASSRLGGAPGADLSGDPRRPPRRCAGADAATPWARAEPGNPSGSGPASRARRDGRGPHRAPSRARCGRTKGAAPGAFPGTVRPDQGRRTAPRTRAGPGPAAAEPNFWLLGRRCGILAPFERARPATDPGARRRRDAAFRQGRRPGARGRGEPRGARRWRCRG